VNRTQNYQYYNDGRIKFMQDEATNLFDRSYAYDQSGRITQALTGHEARGEEFGPLSAYKETFQYDEWNNLTGRTTRSWNHTYNEGPYTYQNNRRPIYVYDSDGRVKADHANPNLAITLNYTYDARGLKTSARLGNNSHLAVHEFDGDGRRAKMVITQVEQSVTTVTTAFEIASTVLGGAVIEQVDAAGVKTRQSVYTNRGIELASRTGELTMIFKHTDPVTATEQRSWTDARDAGRIELDPMEGDVGTFQPLEDDPGQDFPLQHGRLSQPFDHCSEAGLPSICGSDAYTDWGSRIADLPGFGTNWGSMVDLGMWEYELRLAFTRGRNGISRPSREGSRRGTDPMVEWGAVESSGAMTQTQKKNCATPNSIVAMFKAKFESLWDQTVKSGNRSKEGEENGEAIFYEKSSNTYPEVQFSQGTHYETESGYYNTGPQMLEASTELRKGISAFQVAKREVALFVIFHTHPNYTDGESRKNTPSQADLDFVKESGNPLGIIRSGAGYGFFINGEGFGPDDARADECIWDLMHPTPK